jgi:hypothetical protein
MAVALVFAIIGNLFVFTIVIWEMLAVVGFWESNQLGSIGGTANTNYVRLNQWYFDNG